MAANKRNNAAERQFSYISTVRVQVSRAACPERLTISSENFLQIISMPADLLKKD